MADFKFPCPQCAQHIQCDTGYAGTQINCPTCQQPIVVPPPPRTPAAPASRVTAPVKPPKTTMWRNISIAGLCAVVLAAGIFAIIHFGFGNSTRTVWAKWFTLDGDKNQWSFENGKITGHSTTADSILASAQKYGDVTFSATVQTDNREASFAIRMQDKDNGYLVVFAPNGTPILGNNGYIGIFRLTSGNARSLATYRKNMASIGQSAKMTVVAHGPAIEVLINGKKIMHVNDSTFASGSIGLRIYGDPNFPCDGTFSGVTFH
jgi:hypothetical protein